MTLLRWVLRAAVVAALPPLVRRLARSRTASDGAGARPGPTPNPHARAKHDDPRGTSATRLHGDSGRSTAARTDSPNQAEALQASHAQGAYAGIAQSLPGQGVDTPLFPPTVAGRSVPPPEPQDASAGDRSAGGPTPGLPDFARGA